jgi:hypothetical protein
MYCKWEGNMSFRNCALSGLFLLASWCVSGQESEAAIRTQPVLRPEMMDSGLCGYHIPQEGDYDVSLNELIELDFNYYGVTGCGPDKVSISVDNEKVLKPHKPTRPIAYYTGDHFPTYCGLFYKALKRGEATITVTVENLTTPITTLTFHYHITVY